MRIQHGATTVSATDLANHLSCPHLTTLNLRLAKGEIKEPTWNNPHAVVLQQRGLQHEKAYIESLRARGLSVVDLSNMAEESATEATWAAMRSGAQAIVQASLADGEWRGRADVLLRVEQPEGPSRLGGWSYEAVDCKLSRATKVETVLQLLWLAKMKNALFGRDLDGLRIISPEASPLFDRCRRGLPTTVSAWKNGSKAWVSTPGLPAVSSSDSGPESRDLGSNLVTMMQTAEPGKSNDLG